MTWKQFFGFTKIKLILFVILAILMNIRRTSGVCVDALNYGYCISYHGLPFTSFIVTGEVSSIPLSDLAEIITRGLIGFLANALIAYLILSLIFFVYSKIKKKYWN